MLTLRELKELVGKAGQEGRVPTARMLKESDMEVIVREKIGSETEISVYPNGYVLYQVGNRYTVFPLEECGTYGYEAVDGESKVYESSFFDNENWYVRLIMEAEDRMERNQEKIKTNHKVYSYDRIKEEYGDLEDPGLDPVRRMIRSEYIRHMMELLNEKQKTVIYLFYMEEWRQKDISDYLGVSQQSVSEMIKRALAILRKYAEADKL